MADFVCLVATFDDETSKKFMEIGRVLNEAGLEDFVSKIESRGKPLSPVPYHLTLSVFGTDRVEEAKKMLNDVASKTKSFDVFFNSFGLWGLKVFYLTPDPNYEMLDLYDTCNNGAVKSGKQWTPHVTLMDSTDDAVLKALSLIAPNPDFQKFYGTVKSLSLFEFFPGRLLAKADLQ